MTSPFEYSTFVAAMAAALLGAGCNCGATPSTAPGRSAPAAAPEGAPTSPETQTQTETDPETNPETDDDAATRARLREVVSRTLRDARVTLQDSADPQGGWATVAWRSIRVRVEYRERPTEVWLVEHRALEAVAFLHELADAGVALARTGRWLATNEGSTLECFEDDEADAPRVRCRAVSAAEAADPPVRVTLEPPYWMLPPSQRGRSRPDRESPPRRRRETADPPPLAPRITEVFTRHPELRISGLSLDESHGLVLVTADEGYGVPLGVLLCVAGAREAEGLDCATTEIDSAEGVMASSARGWLLAAASAYGNPRDKGRLLVSVHSGDDGLVVDTLDLGGVGGDGEACERHPGYCVHLEGVAHRASVLSPDCVELRPGGRWHATHVRVGDRWIGEGVEPAPGCVARYAVRDGLFARADCGPAPSLPACPLPSSH